MFWQAWQAYSTKSGTDREEGCIECTEYRTSHISVVKFMLECNWWVLRGLELRGVRRGEMRGFGSIFRNLPELSDNSRPCKPVWGEMVEIRGAHYWRPVYQSTHTLTSWKAFWFYFQNFSELLRWDKVVNSFNLLNTYQKFLGCITCKLSQ